VNWAAEVVSTGVSVQTVTAVISLALGIGSVAVGITKAVRGLRKFSRLLDGFLGDGTSKHPSVPDRLDAMEKNQEEFRAQQEQGTADLAAVKAQTASIEKKLDDHVDTEAPGLLADGQAWGKRLDGQVADLGTRVSALEQHTSG
jgi:hypothetical protein